MKERPILFSGPMVRAILEGRKTQTRRILQPQPDSVHSGNPYWFFGGYRLSETAHYPLRCSYGQPGDLLWVRETFGKKIKSFGGGAGEFTAYRATEPDAIYCATASGGIIPIKWKPSIHMPRMASRILLEITAVRVERLQDISEEDAISEGIERHESQMATMWKRDKLHGDQNTVSCTAFPRLAFRSIWESINGSESWDANPWVWAIDFKRVTP